MYPRRQPPQLTRPLLGSSPNLSVAGSVLSDLSQGYLAEQGVLSGEAALAAGKKMTRPGFWAGPFDKAKYRTIQEGDLSRGRNMLESAFALAQVAAQRPETRASALVDFDTAQQEIFRGLAVPENAPRLTDEAKIMRARLAGIAEQYTDREGIRAADAEIELDYRTQPPMNDPEGFSAKMSGVERLVLNDKMPAASAANVKARFKAAIINPNSWMPFMNAGASELQKMVAGHVKLGNISDGESQELLRNIGMELVRRDKSVSGAGEAAAQKAVADKMEPEAAAAFVAEAQATAATEVANDISRKFGIDFSHADDAFNLKSFDAQLRFYKSEQQKREKAAKESEKQFRERLLEQNAADAGGGEWMSDPEGVMLAAPKTSRMHQEAKAEILIHSTARDSEKAVDISVAGLRARFIETGERHGVGSAQHEEAMLLETFGSGHPDMRKLHVAGAVKVLMRVGAGARMPSELAGEIENAKYARLGAGYQSPQLDDLETPGARAAEYKRWLPQLQPLMKVLRERGEEPGATIHRDFLVAEQTEGLPQDLRYELRRARYEMFGAEESAEAAGHLAQAVGMQIFGHEPAKEQFDKMLAAMPTDNAYGDFAGVIAYKAADFVNVKNPGRGAAVAAVDKATELLIDRDILMPDVSGWEIVNPGGVLTGAYDFRALAEDAGESLMQGNDAQATSVQANGFQFMPVGHSHALPKAEYKEKADGLASGAYFPMFARRNSDSTEYWVVDDSLQQITIKSGLDSSGEGFKFRLVVHHAAAAAAFSRRVQPEIIPPLKAGVGSLPPELLR